MNAPRTRWTSVISIPHWRAFLALNVAGWAGAWIDFSPPVAIGLIVLAAWLVGLFRDHA